MSAKTTLIVGGTSGLGLSLARRFRSSGDEVLIAGRTQRDGMEDLSFKKLDLGAQEIGTELDSFVSDLPTIDTLIIAAGYYQEGQLADLSDKDITHMMQVVLTGPTLLLQRLLKKQQALDNLITITSTSQFIPRPLEPVYTAAKSGMAMLSNSLTDGKQIKKTLVAAPGGMRTPFWHQDGRDTSKMLDPEWVADTIMDHFRDNTYSYKFIKLFRGQNEAEVAEKRNLQP